MQSTWHTSAHPKLQGRTKRWLTQCRIVLLPLPAAVSSKSLIWQLFMRLPGAHTHTHTYPPTHTHTHFNVTIYLSCQLHLVVYLFNLFLTEMDMHTLTALFPSLSLSFSSYIWLNIFHTQMYGYGLKAHFKRLDDFVLLSHDFVAAALQCMCSYSPDCAF